MSRQDLLQQMQHYAEGQLKPEELARLNAALGAEPALRREFIELLNLDAALSDLACEALTDDEAAIGEIAPGHLSGDGLPEPTPPAGVSAKPQSPVLGFLGGVVDYVSRSRTLMFWLIGGSLGLYFAVQLGSLLLGRFWAQNAAQLAVDGGAGTENRGPLVEQPGHETAAGKVVARLTNAVDCQWKVVESQRPSPQPAAIRGEGAESVALNVGTEFHAGQKLNLVAGLAELTFDSGAKVILHAPARFDVTDALGGNLQRGKLTAKVPHTAAGFTVATPGGKVVDLGTEFGVKVNDDGAMNVIVYVGDVQIESGSGGGSGAGATDQPRVVHLHAGQAVTVGPDHIAKPIPPENERFIRDIAPLADRTKAEAAYVEFMKALKPVVWFRMEGKADDRVLHDEAGGPDAKLAWDGPGNPFVKGQIGKGLWLRGARLRDHAVVRKYPQSKDGKLSVAAWVYADSVPMYATIASNWGGINGQFHFGLSWDNDWHRGLSVELMPPDGDFGKTRFKEVVPTSFALYEWQHVAFTADGSTVRLYRQGREVFSGNYPGLKYPVPSKALAIGACLNASDQQLDDKYPNLWDGKLDEVAVFNDALTAEQVKKLANFVPR